MSELMSKPLKRFIICFRKEIDSEFKKHVIIESNINEGDAINKICDRYNIPIKKIGQNDHNKEGYIYCNRVYNPTIDEND